MLNIRLYPSLIILFQLQILRLSSPTSAIRLDVSLQEKQICRTTVQGRYLLSDDNGVTNTHSEVRLGGINVIVGKQGESCDTVCKSNGQSCVPSKLVLLNQCEIMQKYMSCRGACLASIGADQPAEVVDDAPRYLNPGACLYTKQHSILSCDGSHKHTRRLCPCA